MKRKKSTALFLALLMIASVFLNATSVFAEQGFFDGLDKDWTEHLNIDAPNIAEDEPVQEETKPILKEEVPADNRTEDVREESPADAIEIGEEIVQDPVTNPGSFDLSKINTIAKDINGNYYGVKTYGNSFDTTIFKTFYKITEEEYNQVAKGCFMVFKRLDGAAFEIPNARIGNNSIADSQPSGTTAGPIFTEVQFKHHMAYRLGFIVNSDPTRVESQKDLTWSIILKKDWVIEPCPEFGSDSNSSPDYAYVYYNVELDGKGHKIYRNDDRDGGILLLGSGQSGNIDIPIKTATIKNLTIDGDGKYFGIGVSPKGVLNLENVTIQNGLADSNHLYYGGAIRLDDQAKLTMDASTVIKNCKAVAGGAIQLLGNNTLDINGSTFSNNVAKIGGAICSLKDSGLINIKNAKFENNKTENISQYYTMNGGAIYSNSKLNIENSEFKNNIALNHGGAIASFADVEINGSTFSDNFAGKNGGAIYSSANKLDIKRSTFKNNGMFETEQGKYITSQGGAIYANTNLTIEESNFSNNVSRFGGAIINFSDTKINESNFNENASVTDGGAIYQSSSSKLDIENSDFIENECSRNGGAIYVNSSVTAKIKDTNFTGNGSNNSGGTIFIQSDNPNEVEILKCIFERNGSPFGGGVYLNNNSKLKVEESKFIKNNAGHGAGISSAPSFSNSSKITINNSVFDDNHALLGGGIFTAFSTEIKGSTFTKNEAQVHPKDDQSNPHSSGVGGAIDVMFGETNIDACKFIENNAYGSGGAIGINGVTRDENDPKIITGLKDNVKVNIKNGTIFEKNYCLVGQGGAIHTIPYSYDLEDQSYQDEEVFKGKAYKNLKTSEDTVFKGNWALSGFFNPPSNYSKFTDLKFKRNSFTDNLPNKSVAKSLLNNYDVNFKNTKVTAYFDPNGGEFTDPKNTNPKAIKEITEDKGKEITLLEAPKRDGYKFLGWKATIYIPEDKLKEIDKAVLEKLKEGKLYKPEEKFKLESDYIFVAQWEEEKPEVKPQPKPEPQPKVEETRRGIKFNFDSQELSKEETHIAYIKGYPDNTVRPEGNITRAEAVTMLVRLKGYPIIEGQGIYKDVAKDEWYAPYIEAAYRKGILEEKEGENFRPDEKITRGELAQLISHVDKKNDAKAPFTDIEGYKYQKAIDQNYGNKRILGYPDNTFKPDAEITRAETAAMLNRLFERSVKEEGLKDVEIDGFKDLKDKNYWAYYEIIEASHTHTYTRIRQNSIEELWKTIIK